MTQEPGTNPQKDIALRIKGLTRRFGSLTAVNNISFDIYRNEIFGFLGPNGAGKTTTISMICGLLPASEGVVEFSSSYGKTPGMIIGYCPQENIFYPRLTCLEQMLFIGRLYGGAQTGIKARALDLLDMLGLKEKANVRAGHLSGGMKRRLNICLAIIHDPQILILDEPEAGLDPQSRILVREFIRSFGKEKTVVLTTHNMDEADRLADRIAVIDHGKILRLDTPKRLKKTIGEGDILEICFENGGKEPLDLFTEKLASLSLTVRTTASTAFVRHPEIVRFLPDIKDIAELCGLAINEYRLRENTLEDVFIHLTGRSLRQ